MHTAHDSGAETQHRYREIATRTKDGAREKLATLGNSIACSLSTNVCSRFVYVAEFAIIPGIASLKLRLCSVFWKPQSNSAIIIGFYIVSWNSVVFSINNAVFYNKFCGLQAIHISNIFSITCFQILHYLILIKTAAFNFIRVIAHLDRTTTLVYNLFTNLDKRAHTCIQGTCTPNPQRRHKGLRNGIHYLGFCSIFTIRRSLIYH